MISVDYPIETGNPKAEEFSHQRPTKKFTINLWKKIFNEFKKLTICNLLISSRLLGSILVEEIRLPGSIQYVGFPQDYLEWICWSSLRLPGSNQHVGFPQD